MKVPAIRLKKCVFAFLSLVAGIVFSNCGLDRVISISEPTVTLNQPLYSSIEYLTWYFAFRTEERDQNKDFFVGTEIYYKIYNNYSNLVSQRSAITSVNSTTYGTAAATKMIDTYTYQPLGSNPSNNSSPFIEYSGSNRNVVLRLKTYKGNESYSGDNIEGVRACVKIDGSIENYVPFRNGNAKSFDFFDDNDDDLSNSRDVEPSEGDSDFYYSSSPSASDTYYVQMFAVGVAFDSDTLSNTYSLVLDLGSVPIKKGE